MLLCYFDPFGQRSGTFSPTVIDFRLSEHFFIILLIVLELHVHNEYAKGNTDLGGRAHELRGHRHEFPGDEHDGESTHQGLSFSAFVSLSRW